MADDKSLSGALNKIFQQIASQHEQEKESRLKESKKMLGLEGSEGMGQQQQQTNGRKKKANPLGEALLQTSSASNSNRKDRSGKNSNTTAAAGEEEDGEAKRTGSLPPLIRTTGGAGIPKRSTSSPDANTNKSTSRDIYSSPPPPHSAAASASSPSPSLSSSAAKALPLPGSFWSEHLAAQFTKKRLTLQVREADIRHGIIQEELDGYEHTLLTAWVEVRTRRAAEIKAKEDAAYAASMATHREHSLMHRLWSEEVRDVRNAIRAEYECEFDALVCYFRAVLNTSEQKAHHTLRSAEKAEAEEQAKAAAEIEKEASRRAKAKEKERDLLAGEEKDGRAFIIRLEQSIVSAMAEVFKHRRKVLLESEGSIQHFWMRHLKKQMHLQHSIEWLVAEEVAKRESTAKLERQRFDSIVSSYPDSYKMAMQVTSVRLRAEQRERAELDEAQQKGRDALAIEFTESLASLKLVEEDEKQSVQAQLDRADRLAGRRALADAHAERERAAMFEADESSWAMMRYAFECSLDYVAAREESYARAELALQKAAEKAFILALLRQRTNLANASMRARAEIEEACQQSYAAINEALQVSQDRFLLQWCESVRRRIVEDEFNEASLVFARHARTLNVCSQTFSMAKKSAVDKPLTNAKSRFAFQLRKNVVPWFFGTDGCKLLEHATLRASASPLHPISDAEELDVTVEILNPHEGDTLDCTPATIGRRQSYLPANYFYLQQLQQEQQQQQQQQQQTLNPRNTTIKGGPAAALADAKHSVITVPTMLPSTISTISGGSGSGVAANDIFGDLGELVEEESTLAANPAINNNPTEEVKRRISVRKYNGDVRQLFDGITFRNVQPFNKLKIMQRVIRINIDTITVHVLVNVLPPLFSAPDGVSVTTNVVTPLGSYSAPPSKEFKKIRCVVALDRESPDNTFSFKLPAAYFNHPKNGILMNGKYFMRLHTRTNALVDVEFDNSSNTDVRPLLNAIKVTRKEGAKALKPLSLTMLITLRDDTTIQVLQFLDMDNTNLDAPKLRVHSLDLTCRVSVSDGPITKANEDLLDDVPFSLLSRASVRFPELQTQFCGGSLSLSVQNDPDSNVGLSIRAIPSERYSFEIAEGGVLWAVDNRSHHLQMLLQRAQQTAANTGDSSSSMLSARENGSVTARNNNNNNNSPATARGNNNSNSPSPTKSSTIKRIAGGQQQNTQNVTTPRTETDPPSFASGGGENGNLEQLPKVIGNASYNASLAATTHHAIVAAGDLTSVKARRFVLGQAFVVGANASTALSSGGGGAASSISEFAAASITTTAAAAVSNSPGSSDIMIKFMDDTFFNVDIIDPLLKAVGYTYRRGAAPQPINAKDKDKGCIRLHMRLDVRNEVQSVEPIDVTFRLAILPPVVEIKNDAFNYKERTGFKALPTMSIKPQTYACSHEARILLEIVDGADEDGSDELTVVDAEPQDGNNNTNTNMSTTSFSSKSGPYYHQQTYPQQLTLYNNGAPIAAVIKHSKTRLEALLMPTDHPWRRTHISHPYPTEAFHCGEVPATVFNSVLRSLAYQSTSNDAQFLKKILRLVIDDGLTGPTSSLIQATIESVDDPTEIILSTAEVPYKQLSRGLLTRGCPLMPGVRLEDVDSDNFHGGYISVEYTTGPSLEVWDDLVILTPEQQELTIHQPEDTSIYSSLYAILGSASKEAILEALEGGRNNSLYSLGASMPRASGRQQSLFGSFLPSSNINNSNSDAKRVSPMGTESASVNENVTNSSAAANNTAQQPPTPSYLSNAVPFPYLSLVAEMAPQKAFVVKDSRMYYGGVPIGVITTRKGQNGNATTLTLLFRSDTKFVSFPAAEYAMRCIGYENSFPRIAAGSRVYTVRLNCTGLKSTAETVTKVAVSVTPAMIFLPAYATSVRFEGDKPKQLLKPAIVTITDPSATTTSASADVSSSPPSPPAASAAATAAVTLNNQGFLRLKVTNIDDWNDEIFIDESLGEVRLKEKAVIVGRDTVASLVPLTNMSVNSGLPKPNYLHLSFVKMNAEGLEAILRSISFQYKNSNSKDSQNLRSRTIEIECSPNNSDAQSVCVTSMTVEMSRKDVPYAITTKNKRHCFIQNSERPTPLLAECVVSDSKGGKGFPSGWVIEVSVAGSVGGGVSRGGGAMGGGGGEYFVVSPQLLQQSPLARAQTPQTAAVGGGSGGGKHVAALAAAAVMASSRTAIAIRPPQQGGSDDDALTIKSPRESVSAGKAFPTTATAANNVASSPASQFYALVDSDMPNCNEFPIATIISIPANAPQLAHRQQQQQRRGSNPIAAPSSPRPQSSASTSTVNVTPLNGSATATSAALSHPPLMYSAAGKSLLIVLEKTLSPSELKELLQCIGYCNHSKADKNSLKSINVTLHRPKSLKGNAMNNAKDADAYNASVTTLPPSAAGISASPNAAATQSMSAAGVAASSSAASVTQLLAFDSTAVNNANAFIPLVRLEMSCKILPPMLDCSLCPSLVRFPWSGIAMGEASPVVPLLENAACEVPIEAADVSMTVFIVTADTLNISSGGGSDNPFAGGLNVSSNASNSPSFPSGSNRYGGRRQSSLITAPPAGAAATLNPSTSAAAFVKSSIASGGGGGGGGRLSTNASRGVSWAIAGRRESGGNNPINANRGGGGGGSFFGGGGSSGWTLGHTRHNSSAALASAFSPSNAASVSAAVQKYGLSLEWRAPLGNPLGLWLDHSTFKIYSGVYGHYNNGNNNAPATTTAGVSSTANAKTTSSTNAAGPSGSSSKVLFGSLTLRGDSVTITYEPPHSSASSSAAAASSSAATSQPFPCDSLVAQAILRCVHLVAKDDAFETAFASSDAANLGKRGEGGESRDGDEGTAASSGGGGSSRQRDLSSKRDESSTSTTTIPIVVSMGCNIGTNRHVMAVQV